MEKDWLVYILISAKIYSNKFLFHPRVCTLCSYPANQILRKVQKVMEQQSQTQFLKSTNEINKSVQKIK